MSAPPRAARAAVAATFFASGALFGTWVARIPAIKRSLGLSDGELGLALLAVAAGAIVAMPLAGRAAARHGSRLPTAVGLVALCVLLVPPAFAPDLPLLALSLFGYGVAAGALDVSMNSHGLAVERGYGRPVLASFHAWYSAGGLAGSALGGLVAATGIGPRPHFAAVAVAFLVLALVAVLPRLLPASADALGVAAPGFALPTRALALVGAVAFCCLFAEGAASDWSAVFVSGPVGAGDGVAALAYAAFSVTMTGMRAVGDALTARWGASALARRGGVLGAAGLAAALVVQTTPVALVGFACLGAGLATVFPLALRAAGGTVELSAVSTAGYAAFLTGPPTIGGAATLVSLPAALGIVVALVVAIVALAPALRPRGER